MHKEKRIETCPAFYHAYIANMSLPPLCQLQVEPAGRREGSAGAAAVGDSDG